MSDWSSIASDVATVGIKLLGALFGETQSNEGTTYRQGDILWTMDGKSITVSNKGNAEQGVSFALSSLKNGTSPCSVIEYLPIPAGGSHDVTHQMSDFADGSVCIGQATNAPDATEAPDTMGAAINFAIRALSLGVAVKIVEGVQFEVGQNKKTGLYQLTFKTKGPAIKEASATIKDPSGASASAHTTFQKSKKEESDSTSYVLHFPSGINPDPLVESLDLSITMDNASYVLATAKSRQRLVKGSPPKNQPSTSH